jgi:hypothetical protein
MVTGEFDFGLIGAIAQWVGVVGLPAVVAWNWKLVQWLHRHDVALSDQANIRVRLDTIERALQDIRGIVIELRTRQDVANEAKRHRPSESRG